MDFVVVVVSSFMPLLSAALLSGAGEVLDALLDVVSLDDGGFDVLAELLVVSDLLSDLLVEEGMLVDDDDDDCAWLGAGAVVVVRSVVVAVLVLSR